VGKADGSPFRKIAIIHTDSWSAQMGQLGADSDISPN
jgi:hypothetical protein